ncbi:MAG: hypothetical protein CMH22_15950 [Methylophaga sp.]|nr:hypothetical protein [Methylophaga sp.]MAX53469.1 hypothetical protein [Methylophaga sp.]|tara:strand:- start:7276 stop:7725 length:450 start_codon:yes stop_codon:yes gene_type:complete
MNYPSELPAALQQGHSVQTVSPLLRSQLASGRARQRRRFTSVPQTVQLEWVMTNSQAQLFEVWFRYGVMDGAAWHDMPVKTALGFQTERVRFTDIYSGPTMISPQLLQYSAEVEIFERQTLPPEWLDFPQFVAGSSIIDLALNREWPAP